MPAQNFMVRKGDSLANMPSRTSIFIRNMAIKQFEILEHTGDAKIRAFGETKERLFLNAMLGMNALLRPRMIMAGSRTARVIKIKSSDLNALLVDFLSEVNYSAQTNREAYDRINFLKFTDIELETELSGRKVESFGEEIKAVTHHGLNISGNDNAGFEATILFDI